MKLLRIVTLALGLAVALPVQYAFAGDAKSGSVFPRNLSVESIAKMVYEAAKNDPANAAVVFMEALSSRDSWTSAELKLVVDALMIAVPDMPLAEIVPLVHGENIPVAVVDDVREHLDSLENPVPQNPIIAVPPTVPVYPVIPSPDAMSGVK